MHFGGQRGLEFDKAVDDEFFHLLVVEQVARVDQNGLSPAKAM